MEKYGGEVVANEEEDLERRDTQNNDEKEEEKYQGSSLQEYVCICLCVREKKERGRCMACCSIAYLLFSERH